MVHTYLLMVPTWYFIIVWSSRIVLILTQEEILLAQEGILLGQAEILFGQAEILLAQEEILLAQEEILLAQEEIFLARPFNTRGGLIPRGPGYEIDLVWNIRLTPSQNMARGRGIHLLFENG